MTLTNIMVIFHRECVFPKLLGRALNIQKNVNLWLKLDLTRLTPIFATKNIEGAKVMHYAYFWIHNYSKSFHQALCWFRRRPYICKLFCNTYAERDVFAVCVFTISLVPCSDWSIQILSLLICRHRTT